MYQGPSLDVFSSLHGHEGSGAVSALYRTATSPAASMAAYASQEQQECRSGPGATLPSPDLQLTHGAPALPSPTPLGCSSRSSSSKALAGAASGDDAALRSGQAFASPFLADAAESRVLDESTHLWLSSRSPPRAAARAAPGRGGGARQALDFHEGAFGRAALPRGRPPSC